jgi:hypothetical protein
VKDDPGGEQEKEPLVVVTPEGGEPDTVAPGPASSLTAEALDVVAKAAAGGVPMFNSANLVRIATENGVAVSSDMTPNDIVEELRRRV